MNPTDDRHMARLRSAHKIGDAWYVLFYEKHIPQTTYISTFTSKEEAQKFTNAFTHTSYTASQPISIEDAIGKVDE